MPILKWVNDDSARLMASKVPFRILERVKEFGVEDEARKNFLVQGDNLDVLKALLPFYKGRVRCIYIDPPYNTRSAFKEYDDNLEHSQWLSMMQPRLSLLREFLTNDGSIWVSIDDDEQAYLKVLMDEIFGRVNFVNTIYGRKNILHPMMPDGYLTRMISSYVMQKIRVSGDQIFCHEAKRITNLINMMIRMDGGYIERVMCL